MPGCITVTLWNQFSEIEAAAMANLPGTFPVAIGMRLKMSNYHGNVTHSQKSEAYTSLSIHCTSNLLNAHVVGWQHRTHQFSEIICIV